MLLRNGNIKKAFRKGSLKFLKACAAAHCCRNPCDLRVFLPDFHHFIPENGGPASAALGKRLSCFQIKRTYAMIRPGTLLCVGIALAFNRFHMNEHRTVHFLHIFKQFNQIRQIMSIHRTNIFKPKLFKQCTARQKHFRPVTHVFQHLIRSFANHRHIISELLDRLLPPTVLIACPQAVQMAADGPHIRINRHLVIIQNDNHSGMLLADIIQRLIRESARHGAIPDDCNHMLLSARQVSCLRKPKRR